jgi:hypothetical protein
MERKPLIPPDNKDYRYGIETALKIAGQKLTSINIEEQCRKAGAELKLVNDSKIIFIEYLNGCYQLTPPETDVLPVGSQPPLKPGEKLLILHYLIQADGSPLTGSKITYKEIPDGATYFPTFYNRAVKPLLDNFGKNLHLLPDTASRLGGCPEDYGDVSVTINAFKQVPMTIVLWCGDEELSPEGSILFDSTISGYLSAEDITVLCETIAWRLVKIAGELKK